LSLTVQTDAEGRYVSCGFKRLAIGTATAARNSIVSEVREFGFEQALIVRRDLTLVLPAPGSGKIVRREVVVAVSDSSGEPVADALVYTEGTSESSRTNEEGNAILGTELRELAVGVRRMGYAPQTVSIRLGESQRQLLRVVLASAQTLPTVSVTARAPLPAVFERRRNSGRGTFFGPEEVAAAHEMKTLVARSPGASVVGVGRWAVRFRHPAMGGDCWADVYIDGRLSDPTDSSFGSFDVGARKTAELDAISPSEIHSVEVYPRASQAPSEFVGVRDGCGVILVWTKSYAEREMEKDSRLKH
jgi:hypothetical protein